MNDELVYEEVCKQEYGGNNCKISSGFVEGAGVDTVYLQLEKDGVEPTTLLLRPDELAAIAWVCTGCLWSGEMNKLMESEPPPLAENKSI